MDYEVWRKNGYITAADAARVVSMPCSTVHRWMRTGKIRFALQGRRHFIKVDDLRAFVRERYTDSVVADQIVEAAERLLLSPKAKRKKGKR